MAPVIPRSSKSRTAPTSTTSRSSSSLSSRTNYPSSSFTTPHKQNHATQKRAKEARKHDLLLSRLQSSSSPNNKITKRRRPAKKLVTNLDALADVLDDAEFKGFDDDDLSNAQDQSRLRRHKSLKSRPGAQKRRQKLEALERSRFGKNLGLMAGAHNAEQPQEELHRTQETEDENVKEIAGRSEAQRKSTYQQKGTHLKWMAIRQFLEGNTDIR